MAEWIVGERQGVRGIVDYHLVGEDIVPEALTLVADRTKPILTYRQIQAAPRTQDISGETAYLVQLIVEAGGRQMSVSIDTAIETSASLALTPAQQTRFTNPIVQLGAFRRVAVGDRTRRPDPVKRPNGEREVSR